MEPLPRLPAELITIILGYTEFECIAALSQTCRAIRYLMHKRVSSASFEWAYLPRLTPSGRWTFVVEAQVDSQRFRFRCLTSVGGDGVARVTSDNPCNKRSLAAFILNNAHLLDLHIHLGNNSVVPSIATTLRVANLGFGLAALTPLSVDCKTPAPPQPSTTVAAHLVLRECRMSNLPPYTAYSVDVQHRTEIRNVPLIGCWGASEPSRAQAPSGAQVTLIVVEDTTTVVGQYIEIMTSEWLPESMQGHIDLPGWKVVDMRHPEVD